jgi:hypothetical protein
MCSADVDECGRVCGGGVRGAKWEQIEDEDGMWDDRGRGGGGRRERQS